MLLSQRVTSCLLCRRQAGQIRLFHPEDSDGGVIQGVWWTERGDTGTSTGEMTIIQDR